MHRKYPPLVAILTTAVVSIAGAATPVVKRAPANISTVQLQQRLAPMLATMQQQQKTEIQQTVDSAQSAFRALAPERAAITRALTADPRYTAYIARAEQISRSSGTPRERATQLAALAKSNRAVFDDALRTARIDRSTLQAKLGAATLTSDLSVRMSHKSASKSVSSTPSSATLAPTDEEFAPPYDLENTDSDNQGLAYQAADGGANSDTGKTRAEVVVVGFAGAARSDSEVGKTFTVPEGFSRMEVTVTHTGSYDLAALGVLGMGGACGSYSVRVANLNGTSTGTPVSNYECVFAPIAWFAEADLDSSEDHKFSVDVPQNDRTFVVISHTHAFALGGGVPGYGDSLSRSHLKKIRVKYIR